MKTEEDKLKASVVLCADWILNLAPHLLLLLAELLTEVHLSGDLRYCREAASNGSGTRDWFCGDNFATDGGGGAMAWG